MRILARNNDQDIELGEIGPSSRTHADDEQNDVQVQLAAGSLSLWQRQLTVLTAPVRAAQARFPFKARLVLDAPQIETFDTFTCFQKLPAEIRLQIWGYCYHPRIIEAFVTHVAARAKAKPRVGNLTRNPSLLSVNQEARQEILKRYSLINNGVHDLYVNFELDTFFIANATRNYNNLRHIELKVPVGIQHLIQYVGPLRRRVDDGLGLAELSELCPDLKTLTIWKDRREIMANGRGGEWLEKAYLQRSDRKGKWKSMPHEERFVKPRTQQEVAHAAIQLAKVQFMVDWEKRRNPAWALERVQIVFLNPEIKFHDWKQKYPPWLSTIIVLVVTALVITMIGLGSTGKYW